MNGFRDRIGRAAGGLVLVALTCFVGPVIFFEHLARISGLVP